MNEKLRKARIELDEYNRLIKEICTEDLTDERELVLLKFFKAGIAVHNNNTLDKKDGM